MSQQNITVLIVDDCRMTRVMFEVMLDQAPEIDVVGVSQSPIAALVKIRELKPDVLILDLDETARVGTSFLEQIMDLYPLRVIMVSWENVHTLSIPIRALELGAASYFPKHGLYLKSNFKENLVKLSTGLIDEIKKVYA